MDEPTDRKYSAADIDSNPTGGLVSDGSWIVWGRHVLLEIKDLRRKIEEIERKIHDLELGCASHSSELTLCTNTEISKVSTELSSEIRAVKERLDALETPILIIKWAAMVVGGGLLLAGLAFAFQIGTHVLTTGTLP